MGCLAFRLRPSVIIGYPILSDASTTNGAGAMGAIAGFMGPFLDYLRPTKSPYLVIQFVAVLVTCFKVTHQDPDPASYDVPRFFLPIFLLVLALVPLSFIRRDFLAQAQSNATSDSSTEVINSKYENDLDSVFKFSRALCLASAVVMLFVYFQNPPADNWYATIAYAMIIVQMITFLLYTAFRHFKGEDLSNVNLFQIAFITAVFFVGSAFLGTQIKNTEPTFHYMYYCQTKTMAFADTNIAPIVSKCNDSPAHSEDSSNITLQYSLDYRQISFLLFAVCWLIYELFWLKILFNMVSPTTGKSKSSEKS